MPGEGPTSTSLGNTGTQDVDTEPSPGMTCGGKRANPGDSVKSPRILRAFMPAKAGTQGGITVSRPLGSRFRGNDTQTSVSVAICDCSVPAA
jgi:hypothetical protein